MWGKNSKVKTIIKLTIKIVTERYKKKNDNSKVRNKNSLIIETIIIKD